MKNFLIQRVDGYGELVDQVDVCAVDRIHALDAANRVMDHRGNRGGFVVMEDLPESGELPPRGYRIPYQEALERYLESNARDFEEQKQEWA